ncbi:glycosyltransferase [Ureibacillus aquaedulcis]|uniref:Glycosyltransferase n=1 Tax=Ureibacillus aquaedulcis TaxID=3058421 RepID=A0ABT8GLQ3_9BACL|nr:glycosyltransferase [Ureibacillus sp. BA0131]MDN4492211.1 glycosyltransferase [Ureibacillus sp. BA0131]
MNISAVIPLYNAEKYIKETLDSLMAQTFPLDEILVVDDCGKDNSAKVVEQYSAQHPIVRLIRQPKNQGGSAARNKGLKEARNNWVLMMDSDDTIHPDLLKLQIKKLKEYTRVNPGVVAIHPAYIQMDADGNIIEKSEYRGQQLPYEETFGSLLVRNYIITPSGLLLNRNAALKIGGYKTNFFVSEDAEFILRLSREGTFVYLDEPYVYFRRHPMSITSDLKKASQAGKAILDVYLIDEVRDAVFRRNYPKEKNVLDFITLLFQFNEFDKGFELLSEMESDEEYEVSKLFLMSLYYLETNLYNEAKSHIVRLLELNDTHGAALNNIGVLFALNGDKEKAKEYFNRALILYPGYMDATNNLKELRNSHPTYRYTKRELRKNLLRYS